MTMVSIRCVSEVSLFRLVYRSFYLIQLHKHNSVLPSGESIYFFHFKQAIKSNVYVSFSLMGPDGV